LYALIFVFYAPATREIYPLSLHDALPIFDSISGGAVAGAPSSRHPAPIPAPQELPAPGRHPPQQTRQTVQHVPGSRPRRVRPRPAPARHPPYRRGHHRRVRGRARCGRVHDQPDLAEALPRALARTGGPAGPYPPVPEGGPGPAGETRPIAVGTAEGPGRNPSTARGLFVCLGGVPQVTGGLAPATGPARWHTRDCTYWTNRMGGTVRNAQRSSLCIPLTQPRSACGSSEPQQSPAPWSPSGESVALSSAAPVKRGTSSTTGSVSPTGRELQVGRGFLRG